MQLNLYLISKSHWHRQINAEISLQSASHNSRVNHQQQSGSQIRELCARFIIACY